MSDPVPAPLPGPAALPRQIAWIIGNEGCERFSFYGMRNILTVFLAQYLLLALPEGERDTAAKGIFHTFVIGVYFFPLLGGMLADRWLGRYRTILWLSLLYCLGHLLLALSESSPAGFTTGLFLIALGSGGIKPCVSAFVGDQFDQAALQFFAGDLDVVAFAGLEQRLLAADQFADALLQECREAERTADLLDELLREALFHDVLASR